MKTFVVGTFSFFALLIGWGLFAADAFAWIDRDGSGDRPVANQLVAKQSVASQVDAAKPASKSNTRPKPTTRAQLQVRVDQLEMKVKLLEKKLAALEKLVQSPVVKATLAANQRVRKVLEQPAPANFEASQLTHVIDYYRNISGVNIFVDWKRLNPAGVFEDTPVTLLMKNVPAGKTLQLVLTSVTPGKIKADQGIAYAVIEGVVTISTRAGVKALSN